MKIGITTAMPEEARAILKDAEGLQMSQHGGRSVFHCRFAGHDVSLIEAGMGTRNAGWAASFLAAQEPDLLISAGFGGAVLPGLKTGDLVRAGQVLHWTESGLHQVEAEMYAPAGIYLAECGCFITSDVLLNKHDLGGLLPDTAMPLVVDMESAAVALVAAGHNIPFLGLRAISDPWDEELAFAINDFCDDQLRIRPLKVFAEILRRPAIIPQLIRLARNSRIAAASLENAAAQLFRQL